MWYDSWSGRSSVPPHLTAPNGLNFRKSVGNPNSRLEKVRSYLRVNGPTSKATICREVFNKVLTDNQAPIRYDGRKWVRETNEVTRGWSTWLFGYGVRHGFLHKERKGNMVLWSVVDTEQTPKVL